MSSFTQALFYGLVLLAKRVKYDINTVAHIPAMRYYE